MKHDKEISCLLFIVMSFSFVIGTIVNLLI